MAILEGVLEAMKLTDVLTPDIRNYDSILLGVWVSLQSLQPSTGILNIESEVQEYLEEDDLYEVMETIKSKLPSGLKVKLTGNIFDSCDYDNLLVGKDYGYLEDGGVVELDEHTIESDKEITDQLESVGIKSKKLRTYVQMISNDNY